MVHRWLVTGLAALALVAGPAIPAYAHNQLVGSDPDDGATVQQGPDEVRLEFLASVDPDHAELAVTGPDGAEVVTAEPDFDGREVTILVDTGLAGDYQVDYRVLSTDGHWAEGAITFTVAAPERPSPSPSPSAAPTTAPAPSPTAGSPAPVANTGTDDGGPLPPWWFWVLILAGGGGLFGSAAWRRSARRRSAG